LAGIEIIEEPKKGVISGGSIGSSVKR